MSDQTTSDVSAEIAGQKFSIRNVKDFNTFATVLTMIGVGVLSYAFYAHATDTKDASKDLVMALKDMTQAAREQNCLMAFPVERREANVDLCKRLSK